MLVQGRTDRRHCLRSLSDVRRLATAGVAGVPGGRLFVPPAASSRTAQGQLRLGQQLPAWTRSLRPTASARHLAAVPEGDVRRRAGLAGLSPCGLPRPACPPSSRSRVHVHVVVVRGASSPGHGSSEAVQVYDATHPTIAEVSDSYGVPIVLAISALIGSVRSRASLERDRPTVVAGPVSECLTRTTTGLCHKGFLRHDRSAPRARAHTRRRSRSCGVLAVRQPVKGEVGGADAKRSGAPLTRGVRLGDCGVVNGGTSPHGVRHLRGSEATEPHARGRQAAMRGSGAA